METYQLVAQNPHNDQVFTSQAGAAYRQGGYNIAFTKKLV